MVELRLTRFNCPLKALLLSLSLLCWYSLVDGDPAGSAFGISTALMDYFGFIDEGFEQFGPTLHCDLLLNLTHEIDNCNYWHGFTIGAYSLKCITWGAV